MKLKSMTKGFIYKFCVKGCAEKVMRPIKKEVKKTNREV